MIGRSRLNIRILIISRVNPPPMISSQLDSLEKKRVKSIFNRSLEFWVPMHYFICKSTNILNYVCIPRVLRLITGIHGHLHRFIINDFIKLILLRVHTYANMHTFLANKYTQISNCTANLAYLLIY